MGVVFKGGFCIENMKLHILFGGNVLFAFFPFLFLDYDMAK